MNTRFLLLLMMVILMLSVGCRQTFRSTSNMMTPSGNSATVKEDFTAKDMRSAILKGCAEKGWTYADINENTIEATIVVRAKHTVVVSIPYTAESYSINYKDSINMDYKLKSDGTFTIHRSYNTWVNNLDQAIKMNIVYNKK